jgi:hypothetical protein
MSAEPDGIVGPEAREKVPDCYDRQARKYRNRSGCEIPAGDQACQHQPVQANDEQNNPENDRVECSIEAGRALSERVPPREG